MNHRICICITGWHFPEDMFRSLASVRDADLFVVSHQPRSKIPGYVGSMIPADRLFVEPNYGYDWGCYQQFLEKGVWKNYTHVVFMHDDIVIKRPDFIEAALKCLEGHSVVGNYRPAQPTAWPTSHPESYFHATWRPSQRSFTHDIVRGSFFMTTTESLARMECFEVFWDRLHATTHFGNWSLKATCAKFQDRCGPDCFGYLSDRPLESEYILELVRGREGDIVIEKRTWLQTQKARLIAALARYYMERAWDGVRQGIILGTLAKALRYEACRPR